MAPSVSICIPAFNAEDTIERAIRSVADQRVEADLEILVCDDGSSDRTRAIVSELSETIPGLRLIVNERNLGRPGTRNRLLSEATGEYLTWLDADDEKYPGMIAAQLRTLLEIERVGGRQAADGVFVYTNYDWFREGWETPKVMRPVVEHDSMESLLSSSFGGYLWLMLGTRATFQAAGPFDERLPRLQDLGFFIRFAELGGVFVPVEDEDPLCIYYKDDTGRRAMQVFRSWNRIWRTQRHHFESYGLENSRRWRRHHYRVSRRFARANADKVAFAWIAAWEVFFIVRGRLRRVFFDA